MCCLLEEAIVIRHETHPSNRTRVRKEDIVHEDGDDDKLIPYLLDTHC